MVKPSSFLCAGVLSCLGIMAHAQDAVLDARVGLVNALMSVDGSVDVVVLSEPEDDQWLTDVIGVLQVSTADQVRFSVGYDVPGKGALYTLFDDARPDDGTEWHVCREWFLNPDHGRLANDAAVKLGGGVLLIDNGATSQIVDNPDASFDEAMAEDPAFKGLFGETALIEDGAEYQETVTLVWVQVPDDAYNAERLERGGFMDGC